MALWTAAGIKRPQDYNVGKVRYRKNPDGSSEYIGVGDTADLTEYELRYLSIRFVMVPGTIASSSEDFEARGPGFLNFTRTGALITGVGTTRLPITRALTIIRARIAVGVAPTGSTVIADINRNGTTIFTTQARRPQIAEGSFISPAAVPDVQVLAAGDYMTIDIDQIGSTVAGSDLTATIEVA